MKEEQEVDKSIVKTFWDQRAPLASDPRSVTLDRRAQWITRFQVGLYQRWFKRNALARAPRPLRRSVDVGCGTGDWSVLLAAHTEGEFVASDLSGEMLSVTQKRIERAQPHLDARFVQCDLGTMSLPAQSDLIMCGAALQYANARDVEHFISTAHASLSPGGLLYLRTTVATGSLAIHKRSDTYDAIYRPRSFYDEAVRKAGLEVLRSSVSTRFVPEELVRVLLPGPFWWLLGWLVSAILVGIWRIATRTNKIDVLALVARPVAP